LIYHPSIESEIEYISSDESVVTNDEVIFRKMYNQPVQLTIKITSTQKTRYYLYDVTVGDYTDGEIRDLNYYLLDSQIKSLFKGDIGKLHHTHPEYDGNIKWSSTVLGVVTIDGKVIKPISPSDIVFYALIQVGDTIRMRSINATIDGYREEFTTAFQLDWLDNIVLEESWGVLNLLN